MKEFFKRLFGLYGDYFGMFIVLIAGLSYVGFVLSPIIFSICFSNAWWLLLYVIVGPVVNALAE